MKINSSESVHNHRRRLEILLPRTTLISAYNFPLPIQARGGRVGRLLVHPFSRYACLTRPDTRHEEPLARL